MLLTMWSHFSLLNGKKDNFETLGWKVEDSNQAHFFEDETKVKISSKIKPLLIAEKFELCYDYRVLFFPNVVSA